MRTTPLPLVLLLAAPGFAQDVFIASNTDQILTRGTDRNADGDAMDFGEYGKVGYDPVLLRQGRELKATAAFGAPALVWLDQTTRDVTRLVDANFNGTFEPAEIASVFDFTTTVGITAANTFLIGLAELSRGDFYIANNSFKTLPTPPPASNGLYRVTGMTTSPFTGALTPAILQSDVVTAWEDAFTPTATTVNAGAWERLAVINATQTILAYNTLDDLIYALRDLDADGKFTSAGEVVNFLNASGHKPGLTGSADFFGGPLSSYGAMLASATPAPANGNWTVLNAIEVDQSNGHVYVATTTTFATPNPAGRVFRLIDANGNGTCNDFGEATVWCDEATPGTYVDPVGTHFPPSGQSPGFTGLGVDSVTHEVFVLSNNGPKDVSGGFAADIVWKLVDLNFDGDADDAGEQILHHTQRPAGSFSLEIEVTPAGFFNPVFACATNFEAPGNQPAIFVDAGCPSGTAADLRPGVRFYKGPPSLGNADFQVSVTGVNIQSPLAQIWISPAPFVAADVKNLFDLLNGAPIFLGLPYPADLNTILLDEWFGFVPFWVQGSPSYVDLLGLNGFVIQGVGTGPIGDDINIKCGSGAAAIPYIGRFDAALPIPATPSLAGGQVRVQWHVIDPSGLRVVSDLGVIQLN